VRIKARIPKFATKTNFPEIKTKQTAGELKMDWYAFTKFGHVVFAIVWVGGGFMLVLSAILAERAGDRAALVANLRNTARLGNLVFMPASLLTLVFGLVMCWFWVGFSEAWVLIGLAGYASAFIVGAGVMKPTSDRLMAAIAAGGLDDAAMATGRRMLRIARFDYTVMLVIISAMVLKPTMDDVAVLVAMAALLIAGAMLFLVPRGDERLAAA
jgi:uncharacterized membrane protein